VAIEATPAFLGGLGQLKIMASAVLFERHPLERTCFTLLRPDSIATTGS
jgi:hypothetical protein